MPIKTAIDTDRSIIIHTITGKFTVEDAIGAYELSFTLPGFDERMGVIWDHRLTVAGDNTVGSLQELKQRIETSRFKRSQPYRVALVAEKDAIYGMARAFQAISGSLPTETLVTRSMDEALVWVAGGQ